MVNLKTIKVSKNINVNFRKQRDDLEQYSIAKRQFEEMLEEAEEDVKNGRLLTQEEVTKGELKLIEGMLLEFSEEEQIEARKFLAKWRNSIE